LIVNGRAHIIHDLRIITGLDKKEYPRQGDGGNRCGEAALPCPAKKYPPRKGKTGREIGLVCSGSSGF
jgi:hypothetical protein